MPKDKRILNYPRRRILRFLTKWTFRAVLKLLFRIEVVGLENFPRNGPLLVVGNHTGAMEVVLLNAYAPRQIEMLSAADTPTERITEIINSIYGSIPVKRGSYNRGSLQKALDVLNQEGMVGIFPEGGVWDVGKQRALPGISWLSYRSGAPILPIGFNDTSGAMSAGLKFKRPYLKMYIGKILEPASMPDGIAKKTYYKNHSAEIMKTVYQLVPQEDAPLQMDISEESFNLEISVIDLAGNQVDLPPGLQPEHSSELGKFFLLPHLLEIFFINLELPASPLQSLSTDPPTEQLIEAIKSILVYLQNENPYLLTYRFGVATGLGMQKGLQELLQVLEWSSALGFKISLRAIRQYFSNAEQRVIIQREQETIEPWM
jgi:1-acyl-sn-glycerol-3-phosphate acyltransferase